MVLELAGAAAFSPCLREALSLAWKTREGSSVAQGNVVLCPWHHRDVLQVA